MHHISAESCAHSLAGTKIEPILQTSMNTRSHQVLHTRIPSTLTLLYALLTTSSCSHSHFLYLPSHTHTHVNNTKTANSRAMYSADAGATFNAGARSESPSVLVFRLCHLYSDLWIAAVSYAVSALQPAVHLCSRCAASRADYLQTTFFS